MFAVIMAGGIGEKASAQQMVLCFEDPADQMLQLEIDLAACDAAFAAAMAGPNAALAAAQAAHAAAVNAAWAAWWLATQACAEGDTWCIMRVTGIRDRAIAAVNAALAAANAAHFAALQAANAAHEDCVNDAVNRFIECLGGGGAK